MNKIEPDSSPRNGQLAVCLAPIFGSWSYWLQLLQVIEWHKLQGVEKFFVYYQRQIDTTAGKILSYYTDVMYFFYNKQMLDEAGISSPPTTWAEVTEQGKILQAQNITSDPFMVGLQAGSWFDEAFFALIYSEGAALFDENLDPVFATDSGPMYDMIEYLAAAVNDDEVIPLKALEMTAVDVQEAFKAGDTAFAIVPGYMVREFNTPGISKVAGQAEHIAGVIHGFQRRAGKFAKKSDL